MGRRTKRKSSINTEAAREFVNHLVAQRHSLILLVPLFLIFWAIERWVLTFSNWVPLVVAVWATLQYGNYQRAILSEDLNKKWRRTVLNASESTPLEQCQWLNKLLSEIWTNYMNRKLSFRFASMVEKRLRQRRSRLIENIQLLEFSLGTCPPSLGLHGTCWSTSSEQKIMRIDFDWDTTDLSILLQAKLAKPFNRTARIVVNSLHIKGDIVVRPILEGMALLYSFVSTPEVRIGVAFGSGGGQSLPATELPGVSSWLVKILMETLNKRMVEPRRGCFALPATDLHKTAVGGIIYVTVVSGSRIYRNAPRGSPPREGSGVQRCVEVELEQLSRKTEAKWGPNPTWQSTFNMILHDTTGILRFNLYEIDPGNVRYDCLSSCEVKMRYVGDDSTIFWAVGTDNGVIAKHAEFCGQEVEMVVPFEGLSSGELTVRLVLKEWHFSDGSHSLSSIHQTSSQLFDGSSNFLAKTGRKITVTVLAGKNLVLKDKNGKCDAFVKLHYGKSIQRTKAVNAAECVWNQKFEFEELTGGEYLKVKCYREEILGTENLGSASLNLQGIQNGEMHIWVPLEDVNSGELELLIEATKPEFGEAESGKGLIELVLVEARDLVAADLRGTSDPYVRVHYGDKKQSTKVIYKTLNPKWNQTMEFPDDGSSLELHVKDHNALLPTSSIGSCVVEYQRLPPNETSDKWIPLQGVTRGEIRVKITRKVPELPKRPSADSGSPFNKAQLISNQMKQMMVKFQNLIDDGDLEGLSEALGEMESLEDEQAEYMLQLQTEQTLLINKIKELGKEILNSNPNPNLNSSLSSSPSPSRSGSRSGFGSRKSPATGV
ncbi:PREDICTED: extended synaptotagmin-1 [Tarenaya hassleriana]|uniref:extended synaptotagmin-1 n=1 Tax=Tarenaya hassleriana TaxID=28532 RepID=UPI00053CA825|nr:PREDICTED: extended synaptotagmin-1 [Tarenaya hassleriana]